MMELKKYTTSIIFYFVITTFFFGANRDLNQLKSIDDNCVIESTLKKLFFDVYQNNNQVKENLLKILSLVDENKELWKTDCGSINTKIWFSEKATSSFYRIIETEDQSNLDFNGFQYLDQIRVLYQNNSEQTEVIANVMKELALNSPSKFVEYIDSIENQKAREAILSHPAWNEECYERLKNKVNSSKYQDEILFFLKNSG